MPLDSEQNNSKDGLSESPSLKKARDMTNQSTMAFELPFTFVGAVAVGGLIGYYLDKWLHTTPWLLVLFGGFGFVAGVLEIARRLGPRSSSSNGKPNS
jgi:F0F1-type ATP synthase assembly protein I